jgi:hypothetical protein
MFEAEEKNKNKNTSIINIKIKHPAIRIKCGKEMSINKMVLHALNNPENIHFWWSKSKRVLLISSALETTPLSFNINDHYYKTKAGFKIEKRQFIQTVIKIMDWRRDMIYAVMGEYIAELNMVAFKLDDAVKLEVDSEN